MLTSRRRLRLQSFEVLLAELGDFGSDDHLAVRLEPVVAEVVLVVVLGDVELVEGRDLGHDGVVPDPLRLQVGDHLFRNALLLFVVVEDHGPVLRPHVRPLTVEGRRVVDGEVNLQDVPVRDFVGVERDLYDLGVSRRLGANLPVGRVGNVTPRVPGLDLLHAPQLLVDRLQAPEAAASERRDLRARYTVVLHLPSFRIFPTVPVYRTGTTRARRSGHDKRSHGHENVCDQNAEEGERSYVVGQITSPHPQDPLRSSSEAYPDVPVRSAGTRPPTACRSTRG